MKNCGIARRRLNHHPRLQDRRNYEQLLGFRAIASLA
jgi:hypothetical protein